MNCHKNTVVILLPLTGIYAFFGVSIKRAIQLYLDKNPGKKIKFIIENTRSNDNVFENLAKTYIAMGVRTFIGGVNSREVRVWVERIQPCYGKIATLLSAGSTEVFEQNSYSVVRIIANNQASADAIYYWLFHSNQVSNDGSNIGILYFDSNYGRNYADRLRYWMPNINSIAYTARSTEISARNAFQNDQVSLWVVVSIFDQETIISTNQALLLNLFRARH